MVTEASFLFWFNVFFVFYCFLHTERMSAIQSWVYNGEDPFCLQHEYVSALWFCVDTECPTDAPFSAFSKWWCLHLSSHAAGTLMDQLAGLCCLGSGNASPVQPTSLKSSLTVRVGCGKKFSFNPKWNKKRKRSLSWTWQHFGSAGCSWWLSVEA